MTIRAASLCLAASLLAMTLPAQADATRDGIDAGNAQFVSMLAKNDAVGVTALYTEDAKIMPAGSDNIKGSAAILKFWQGALGAGLGGAKMTTLEVHGRGATATEVGEYEMMDKTGKSIDHGKYIVVWKHEGSKWKMHRDMFSTSVAAKPTK